MLHRLPQVLERIDAIEALLGGMSLPREHSASQQAGFDATLSRTLANGANDLAPTEAALAPASLPRDRRAFDAIIEQAARREGLSPHLIHAVVRAESNYDPRCRSSAGAMGLMQLMPGTARGLGVTDPWDPQQNVAGGTRYLRQQIDRFGDLELALAAYNAGPGAVTRHGGIPPYRETQTYVRRVISFLEERNASVAADSPGTGTEARLDASVSQIVAQPALVEPIAVAKPAESSPLKLAPAIPPTGPVTPSPLDASAARNAASFAAPPGQPITNPNSNPAGQAGARAGEATPKVPATDGGAVGSDAPQAAREIVAGSSSPETGEMPGRPVPDAIAGEKHRPVEAEAIAAGALRDSRNPVSSIITPSQIREAIGDRAKGGDAAASPQVRATAEGRRPEANLILDAEDLQLPARAAGRAPGYADPKLPSPPGQAHPEAPGSAADASAILHPRVHSSSNLVAGATPEINAAAIAPDTVAQSSPLRHPGAASSENRAITLRAGADARPEMQLQLDPSRFSAGRLPGGAVQRLVVEVDPPQLGRCELELIVRGGELRASIIAERPETAAALLAVRGQIRAQLAEQGLEVTQFDVRGGNGHGSREHHSDSPFRSPEVPGPNVIRYQPGEAPEVIFSRGQVNAGRSTTIDLVA